jgi:autotransporter-associated beta strand protein
MKPKLSLRNIIFAGSALPITTTLAALFASPAAHAATFYWEGGTGNWVNSSAPLYSNWSTTISGTTDPTAQPGSADDLIFNTTAGAALANVISHSNGARAARSLTFDTSGSSNFRAGGASTAASTLTIGVGGITMNAGAGAVTLGQTPASYGNITVALGGAQSWTNNGAGTLTVVGNVTNGAHLLTIAGSANTTIQGAIGSGTGGITKNGNGVLTLSGNNSYTGGTLVNGTGALTLSHSNAAGTNTITFASTQSTTAATFLLSGGINVANAIVMDATNGRHTVNSTGSNTLSGNITINNTSGNSIVIQNSSAAAAGATFTVGGATPNITTITGSTYANTISFRNSSSGNFGILNSQINAPNATFNINNIANWTINSTENTWAVTSLTSGTLKLGASDALATGAHLLGNTSANTTTLDMNGKNQTVSGLAGNTVTTGANIITNNGATDSTLTLSGLTAERGSNFTIQDGATNKISLVLDNANANAQRLYFGSTYSGGTTLLAGRLNVENSNALGTAGVLLAGTGVQLRLASGIVDGTTTVTLPAGNSITVSDTGDNKVLAAYGTGISHVIEGGITINETTSGNFELQVGNTTTLTINGAITGTGGAGIRKTTLGTLVLNNTNDYTGATSVNGGTLEVALGASTAAGSAVTVTNSGSALVVNGTVNGTLLANASTTISGAGTVNGAATINGLHSPGNSPGIQTFTNGLNYGGTATLNAEFVGNALALRGTDFDGVNVTGGNLTVDSLATFALFTSGIDYADPLWDSARDFTVIAFSGAGTSTGSFVLDTANAGSFASEGSWSLANTSNDIMLSWAPIPEPSVTALIGTLGGILLLRRRR